MNAELLAKAKSFGFSDRQIAHLTGQTEDAVSFYQQALQEDPQFAEALLNLGHALMAMGQEEEARSYWRRAIREKPEPPFQQAKPMALERFRIFPQLGEKLSNGDALRNVRPGPGGLTGVLRLHLERPGVLVVHTLGGSWRTAESDTRREDHSRFEGSVTCPVPDCPRG